MKHLNAAPIGAIIALLAVGCTETEPPPTVSLDGPSKITLGRVCLVDSGDKRLRVAAERCDRGEFEGTVLEHGYLTNQLGDSVAVVNFNRSPPQLIDTREDVPGVSHIPVGGRPQEIVTSTDGNFVFAYNQLDQDISVISDDTRLEIARIPVGSPIAAMFTSLDTVNPGADALWLVLSDKAQIVQISWSFTCDGGAEYFVGCEPEFTHETQKLFQFAPDTVPRHAALSPDNDGIFVTFGNRAELVEVQLIAGLRDEPATCLTGGAAPCMVRQIGLTYGCSDGLDNDGDGLIDGADPQCIDPDSAESDSGVGRSRATACNDGIDNDGDGKIDGADDGCAFAGDGSELGAVRAVACSDGLDNDGDGNIDMDDDTCTGPWGRSELERLPVVPLGTTVCSDGLDNDLDGAVDLDDPGCIGLDGEGEVSAVRACSDGIDNDGDGLLDYPEDPDCYGASGSSEQTFPVFEYGPLAIDPEGRFAYVVDRREPQVMVVDLVAGRLLDTNDCPAGGDCRPRPFDSRVGVLITRLPQSIVARRLVASSVDSEDGRFNVTRTRAFANVSVSRGASFFIEGADIIEVRDNGEVVETIIEPQVRIRDAISDRAAVSSIVCSLTDNVRTLVLEARGSTRTNVFCEDPELPQIAPPELPPLAVDCDTAADESCACETLDSGDERCVIDDPARRASVEVRTREQHVRRFDDNSNLVKRVVDRQDDFFIVDDAWSVTYEGVLVARTDALVDTEVEGVIRTSGGNFCGSDVRPGDMVTLTSPVTPLSADGAEPSCDVYRERDLTYRVDAVRGDHLLISVVSAADAARLNRAADAPALAEVLPVRTCFGAGMSIEVRPVEQWIVSGSRTGVLSNQTSFGGVCVQRFDTSDHVSRLNDGDTFINPFFAFKLEPGTVRPPSDFELTFSTSSRFAASQLTVGPSPTDTALFPTRRGTFLPIVDAGTNIVRVFNAVNNELIQVLF